MTDDAKNPALALWEQRHREATRTLADFADTGEVDWSVVLTDQQALLDDLLARQDRTTLRRTSVRKMRHG